MSLTKMFFKTSCILLICSFFVSFTHQKTGEFWQFTDFHWDKNYTRFGGNVSAMCWASVTNSTTNGQIDVGRFGNYQCDAPWELVTSALNFAKQHQPNPDFIIWTGDDDSHVNNSFFSPEKVLDIMRTMSAAINATFPGIAVLPTFGNHDVFPKSCFSPQSLTSWYKEVADLWKGWLTPQAYQCFQMGGYYQMPHPTLTNVKVIGLNTNIYYNTNKLVNAKKDPNPLNQMTWLDETLSQLAANNQSAYIISHVPPGVFGRYVSPKGMRWFRHRFNSLYVNIIVKHAGTIIGQFYGHDHTDSFKIYYDQQGEPVNLHFVCRALTPGDTRTLIPGVPVNLQFGAPAVTPWNTTLDTIGPNNPGLRLYKYDITTGHILNYEQYYLNLREANANNEANWKLEYDFLSTYNLPDMSPASVDRMVQTFATSDRTNFNKFYLYNSVSFANASFCDVPCQRNAYCAIVNVNFEPFVRCNSQNSTSDEEDTTLDPSHNHRRAKRTAHT